MARVYRARTGDAMFRRRLSTTAKQAEAEAKAAAEAKMEKIGERASEVWDNFTDKMGDAIPEEVAEQYADDLSGKNGAKAQVEAIQELADGKMREYLDQFTVTGPGGQALSGKFPFFTTNDYRPDNLPGARSLDPDEVGARFAFPWWPYVTSGTTIGIRPGVINGSGVPTNMNSTFVLQNGANYVYVDATLSSGEFSSATIVRSGTAPSSPPASATSFPSSVYHLLFYVEVDSGAIDWSTHSQSAWHALYIHKFVTEIAGSPPNYDVKYNVGWGS